MTVPLKKKCVVESSDVYDKCDTLIRSATITMTTHINNIHVLTKKIVTVRTLLIVRTIGCMKSGKIVKINTGGISVFHTETMKYTPLNMKMLTKEQLKNTESICSDHV